MSRSRAALLLESPTSKIIPSSPSLMGITALTVVVLPRLQELVGFLLHFRLGLLANALCLAILLSSKIKVHVPWMRLPQVKIYIFFLFWMVLSAVFGVWPSASIKGLTGFLLSMLFFVFLLKTVNSISDLLKLIFVLMLAMIVLDIAIVSRSALGRADAGGYTLDANESALLVNVTMPFFYYLFRSSTGKQKVVGLTGIVCGVAAVFATASRGGLIALCVVLGYGFFLEKGPAFKKIILVVGTILLITFLMPDTLRDRFSRLGDAEEDYNLTSKHGRSMVWERAISMVKEYPLLGVGMNNFIFTESKVNNQSRGVVAHNFVLQAGTELGIPGVLALLALFAVSWKQVRLLRHIRGPDIRSLPGSLLAAVECAWVAFFVGGQFLSVAFSSQIVFLAGCSALIWKFYLRGDFESNVKSKTVH